MDDWNFDIREAPKGEYVSTTRTVKGKEVTSRDYQSVKIIAATDCNKVIITWWLPQVGQDGGRWNFFCKGQEPLAWMPYPKHPNASEVA